MNISGQADAVRHLFMALEQDAKKIKSCPLCDSDLPAMKLANQGYLTGNHSQECPFEQLAEAGELCIKLRDDDNRVAKDEAERALSEQIVQLFDAMGDVPCPFPVCGYTSGHRMQCPFSRLERYRAGR
jgi:hypothetical protein